eukprot:363957-Chlamydomonas_euryale.AAC.5
MGHARIQSQGRLESPAVQRKKSEAFGQENGGKGVRTLSLSKQAVQEKEGEGTESGIWNLDGERGCNEGGSCLCASRPACAVHTVSRV